MFGKKSNIRKYKNKLRPALSKRYGGSATYTKGQIDKTIDDLGFSKKYINYAYLMYCDVITLKECNLSNESIESMKHTIASATGLGILGILLGLSYYSGGDGGASGGGE